MKKIWVKSTDNTMVDLGFKPVSPGIARQINGAFTMADGYMVPEADLADVTALLQDCKVVHEVEG